LGQPILRGELGFIRGERLQAFVNQLVENRSLQALPRKIAVIATDLQSGKPVAFTQGNAGMAVRASSAVPGVFVPPLILGKLYVDGQVSSPVPVAMARMLGATTVIAVDATFPPEQAVISNTSSVLFQSFTIATQRIKDQELENATLVIRPEINSPLQLGFDDRSWIIATGEKAARNALPELLMILSNQPK
jgi:NTE family protein